MILFRRKYPRWWFDWNLELQRFINRVWTYLALMNDSYPSTDDRQWVQLDYAYAISALICKAATEAGIDPDRVKFKRTVRILRRRVVDPAFSPEQQHQRAAARVMADIARKKNINPQRRDRTYPRVVKRARHNSYRVKKPGDHGIRHDGRD